MIGRQASGQLEVSVVRRRVELSVWRIRMSRHRWSLQGEGLMLWADGRNSETEEKSCYHKGTRNHNTKKIPLENVSS